MKKWLELMKNFLKKEWFLLVMIAAISAIVMLFEIL